ncbi:malonyl CoA-acyl carrier protein transacylase [Deferribacterales bacterium]|nr:malonyl CoA-acyl carrier protein transacylase [Deferribacterales bacterium]
MGLKAVVFPGQGSQSVGMGCDLLETASGKYFKEADATLGYSISDIMFNGGDEKLRLTENTQPALLLHSVALWKLLEAKFKPDYFAGHSLGEYSALVAAGGLEFMDAVKAVHKRGSFMQSAVPVGVGAMMAVLGSKDEDVIAVCKEVSRPDSIVEPANFNSDGQVVVAGHIAALQRFELAMKANGAKRVVSLPVSAPFHCSLMKPAQASMADYLTTIEIKQLTTSVINNVDAAVEDEPSVVYDALVRQMSGAVKWSQSVRKLISLGVTTFVEVGAGAVLTGLIRKIDKGVECVNISKLGDLEKILR